LPDVDAYRAPSTSHIRRTIARSHAVIADNQTIVELFPWRARAARKRIRLAHGELKRAELALDILLRA
jgi:hypothetical protein